MLEFRYDTQLLIEGENLDEDKINEYFTNIVLKSEKSMILLLKIWIDRREG